MNIPKIAATSSEEEKLATINELIDDYNFQVSNLSLFSNLNGEIVTVSFAAGEDKVIPHKLGVLPRFRIILRQEGNGVLSDTPSGWNQFQIKMINNGAVNVTATILIARE